MVKVKTKNNKKYYQCEECKMYYKTESLAKKCENFCKKYKGCNLKIIKYAVKI